jgi:hypothetical protein
MIFEEADLMYYILTTVEKLGELKRDSASYLKGFGSRYNVIEVQYVKRKSDDVMGKGEISIEIDEEGRRFVPRPSS